ncbi:DUF1566 domain-containing protein [Spirochaetota bacterium]
MKRLTFTMVFISLVFCIILYAAGSYTDNSNGTIKDNITGLTWTRCSMTDANSSNPVMDNTTGCTNTPGIGKWTDAMAACENLDFAGKTDWRLPNVVELHSLVDVDKSPLIDTAFFPNIPGIFAYYWTSTTYNGAIGSSSPICSPKTNCAWYVNFNDGYVEGDKIRSIKSTENYVRCVSGP